MSTAEIDNKRGPTKDNPRLPSFDYQTFLESDDYQVVQELTQEFKPWREALINGEIPPHSAQEYAILLFEHGVKAREQGNYGIAAVTIWRPGEKAGPNGEITIRQADPERNLPAIIITRPELANKYIEIDNIGHNKVFFPVDPSPHAERQSGILANNLWQNIPDNELEKFIAENEEQGTIIIREAPDDAPGIGMVTTLEPCIGCTEYVLTSGYDWVVSLNEDILAGGLHGERWENLPEIWKETIPNMTKIDRLLAQEENPNDLLTYLPKELAELVARLFFETRINLDNKLAAGGQLMLIPGVKKEI